MHVPENQFMFASATYATFCLHFSGVLFSIDPEQATISLQNGEIHDGYGVLFRQCAAVLTNFPLKLVAQC
jgi:hypothetical protein